MRATTYPRVTAVLAAAAAFIPLGCKVDKDAFNTKIFGCNPSAADPACGTNAQNQPMACVPAYQLGGRNFCALGCDATGGAIEGAEATCVPSGPKSAGLASGALLDRCDPSLPDDCPQEELSCLRTDLIKPEGVCMTVNSCAADSDCRDPVRSKCMGVLLRENYTQANDLHNDHTYCLQFGCRGRRAACSPGETCLRDALPSGAHPSDICVPNCDANRNCPPNYFCDPEVYSRISPPICIPGLLGLRCRTRVDCLFGDCVDVGGPGDPKVCSVGCENDGDCTKYDSIHGTFFCNANHQCAGARGMLGGDCHEDADCHYNGEICAGVGPGTDLCQHTCDPMVGCPAFGGVPHVCRPQFKNGNVALDAPWFCWPGSMGSLFCQSDEQCLPSLSCLPANPLYKVCSITCDKDEDCGRNHFTASGWCDGMAHICKEAIDDGGGCERGSQCVSGTCLENKTCATTPGY